MRRLLIGLTGPLILALALVRLPAHADAARTPAIANGVTRPAYSFADAIREMVYVEAPVDSDGDGRHDRVAVYVQRPKETGSGLKVASILEGSPYFGGLVDTPYHPADVTDYPRLAPWSPPTGPKPPVSYNRVYYDNYFVSRGYAVLAASTLGTADSTGCPTAIGPNEVAGMKAVVEWLTGKAKAYDASGKPVSADWSTHNVAMAGKSYDGTLPLATAVTGVAGLKTVVSLSGLSSWYDYYRQNGGVVAPGGYNGEDADLHAKVVLTRRDPAVCAPVMHRIEKAMDRVSGDYNAFWDIRNFAERIGNFHGSVFVTGGLNDWNVKPIEFAELWQALKRAGLQRKLWIHQAQHDDPIDVRQQVWLDTVNRWFAHYLYGADNGITAEPKVDLEKAPGQWTTASDWPAPSARPVSFHLSGGQPGTLGIQGSGAGQAFVDAPSRTAEDLVADPGKADPNRLLYLTPSLTKAVRLSGTPEVRLRAAVDGRSPYLSALLVDYGTDTRFAGFETTDQQWCFGDSIPSDPGCRPVKKYVMKQTPLQIVTRGSLDIRNRHSPARTEPVTPGRTYTFDWPAIPQDYVFKPGHRIGLLITATDHDYTLRYPAGTKVTVRLAGSSLRLPLTSGE